MAVPDQLGRAFLARVGSFDFHLSQGWSNRHELTLAKDFVDRLETLPVGESGRVYLEVTGTDEATKASASELSKALEGKSILGLVAQVSPEVSARPEGPAIACRVKLKAGEALVQVLSSDPAAKNWVPCDKFNLPLTQGQDKFDALRFADSLAEGVLSRLVRAQCHSFPLKKVFDCTRSDRLGRALLARVDAFL